MSKYIRRILPIAFWIIIWQLASVIVRNQVLFAGPIETLNALHRLSLTEEFWISIGSSTLRILLGFIFGVVLGTALAGLAHYKNVFRVLLRPVIMALKSVPVASFAILLLIWFGSRNISVVICMLVVLPIFYLSTLEGLDATDRKLLEMAGTFRMPRDRVIRYIYMPQLAPFVRSAIKLAIGMSFKSGAAAEVIGQPLHSIGNGIYNARIYLETGELFAWTIAIIFISFVCEQILMRVLK